MRLNGRVLHNVGKEPVFVEYGPDKDLHYLLSVPRPVREMAPLASSRAPS